MKYRHILLVLLVQLCRSLSNAEGLPEAGFSFDNPPGPRFTEAEKQSQRRRGAGVSPMVRKAFEGGAESVVIPPGDYRFGQESWGPDGPIYPLEFRGLARDAAQPLRIIAEGVTFWFDLPPDQVPHAHFALGFVQCSHITLEGVTLDRDPHGNLEGRVTQIDDAGNRVEIEATEGSLIPASFKGSLDQRLLPFKADGAFCAALYALQHRPGRLRYRNVEPGSQPRRCWVNLDEKSELLKVIRDPMWRRAYGNAGTLQVGDGLSFVYTTTLAIGVVDCSAMRFLGVRNYITKGCVHEFGGGGGHAWKNCYFGPRPGTCQWQGSDGFLSGCMERGSTYDGLTMLHTTDDVLNINGFWGYIEKCGDRTITLQRAHQIPAKPGDKLLFYQRQDGKRLGEAVVVSVDGPTLTLDRDAKPLATAIAENPQRQCNGWEVRNCTFRDCYQRFLVQGGNGGVLRDCRFLRMGSSIELFSSFFTRNEGGICRDISVLGNTFEDVAIHPEGITVNVGFESLDRKAEMPLPSGIIVRDNTFINSGKWAVEFNRVDGGDISGNTFHNCGGPRFAAGHLPPEAPAPVLLTHCVNVAQPDNRVIEREHKQHE
jgi:hypothetical protein